MIFWWKYRYHWYFWDYIDTLFSYHYFSENILVCCWGISDRSSYRWEKISIFANKSREYYTAGKSVSTCADVYSLFIDQLPQMLWNRLVKATLNPFALSFTSEDMRIGFQFSFYDAWRNKHISLFDSPLPKPSVYKI